MRVTLSVVATLFLFIALSNANQGKPWEISNRLPVNVIPQVYNVLLYPNLKSGTFTGSVDIQLKISAPCDYIVLHQKGLKIKNTKLKREKEELNLIKKAFDFPKNEFWVVELNKQIPPGKYNLLLEFSGSLTKGMFGFYRSSYRLASSNETRYIATTNFEPTDARAAFPCFDESIFKAKFKVSLVRPSEGKYIALSNMNQVEEVAETPGPGLTTVRFALSKPMSTYLACFIVCDFEKLPTKKTKRGLDVNVYARSGNTQKMKYAQSIAASTIDYYIDYFGIDYPLPKLDLIAIPDFEQGAMENWGLITFRETEVMYDPDISSSGNQVAVCQTVTHELAHMWFGNLVTMKWWDDLWLNEGFATFIEFKGTNYNHPEWEMDTYFIKDQLIIALHKDCILTSHPIIQHVTNPNQITEIFDDISYDKGASVIRMLEGFMGEEQFRKGVVSYLKQFQYGNAETKDLWDHLKKFSKGVNVPRVMDTWTRQMGFPVLTVTRARESITVTQERYTSEKNAAWDANESPFKYKWDVPVTFFSSKAKKPSLNWLLIEDKSLNINIQNAEWYKLNHHFIGYYRVNYPPNDWATLSNLLLHDIKALDAADRTNLLDDAFSLAASGRLDYSVALPLTRCLAKETHLVVWSLAELHLLGIDGHIEGTSVHSDYRKYLGTIIGPHIKDSMWEFPADASFLQKSWQTTMLYFACRAEVPACLQKAKQLFNSWLSENGPKPHKEIRSIVYRFGVVQGTEEQWEKTWERYLAEQDPQEQDRLRYALCYSRKPQILSRLIELAKNETYVRSQDYFYVLMNIASFPIGNSVVWDWIRKNWDYLVKRFTLDNDTFGELLPSVISSFKTREKLKEVEDFIAKYPEAGAGELRRKSAVETIKLNIRWLEKHLNVISKWLKTV